jgi:hypothetical protein
VTLPTMPILMLGLHVMTMAVAVMAPSFFSCRTPLRVGLIRAREWFGCGSNPPSELYSLTSSSSGPRALLSLSSSLPLLLLPPPPFI